jgi:uncharacterized protein
VKVWIDVDNPPQVRYLAPLIRRFQQAGFDVLVTARAYGETFAMLRDEGIAFETIGLGFGKGLPRKLYGLSRRARLLVDFLREQPAAVDFVLTGSRAATLAARILGIPSFVIIDYEHVNVLAFAGSASHILYPSVVDPAVFRRRGVRRSHLMPFHGFKEHITFADADFARTPAHRFTNGDASAVRVLFRPPAEESHYYRRESLTVALELLRYLAEEDACVVFSPRDHRQVAYLEDIPTWRHDPIVLREPIGVVPLLKGVDAVVSAGGTMLREAAYLGVPAYSVFRGRIGAVDRYLASIGRLEILASPADFSRFRLRPNVSLSPIREEDKVADSVVAMISDRAYARSQRPDRRPAAT